MKYTLSALLLIGLIYAGCELIPAVIPDDWAYNPPQPAEQDTTGNDTCTTPVEYTLPAFITGSCFVPVPTNPVIWQYSNLSSNDLCSLLAAMGYNYPCQYYAGQKEFAVILKGTNATTPLSGKIYTRDKNGAKCLVTFSKQAFLFGQAADYQEYSDAIDSFPSVDWFNFRASNFDSLQVHTLSLKILGECKKGRNVADFRFSPISDSLANAFKIAGWKKVLQ